MIDKDTTVLQIKKFVENDSKRILLLKGYDDDAKFRVAFGVMRQYFSSGIINCGNLKDIDDLINRAYRHKKIIPKISTNKDYIVWKTRLGFNSYYRSNTRELIGSEKSFSIFFPIESALVDEKLYSKLVKKIDKTRTKKVVLIPTNEHNFDLSSLEVLADESYFYNVENDNPDLIKIMKENGSI